MIERFLNYWGLSSSSNSQDVKIPRILHYVWITPNAQPQQLINLNGISYKEGQGHQFHKATRKGTAFNYLHHFKRAEHVYDDWDIYLWTNSKALIADSVKILEENTRIEIKELSELGHSLKPSNAISNVENNMYISKCKSYFEDFNYKGLHFGSLVDFARYCVIYAHGGLSHDINFFPDAKISNKVLTQYSAVRITENYYFAYKINHPVMKNMIDRFHLPSKTTCSKSDAAKVIDWYYTEYGKVLKEMNLVAKPNENNNVVHFTADPNYRTVTYKDENNNNELTIIGTDMHEQSWETLGMSSPSFDDSVCE